MNIAMDVWFRLPPTSISRSIWMAVALATLAGSAEAQNAVQNSGAAQQSVVGDSLQEESLQEVVVTAERRSENLQRTPVAVSVRDGADLMQQGKFTVEQILEDVPSVNMTPAYGAVFGVGDSPSTTIAIRGVQANGGVPGNFGSLVPAVALYVDGVYNGIGGGYDIGQVEVLRGPQGTLYGRSATAGVVNVHTTAPMLGSYAGNVAVEIGQYDLQHYSGAVNLPLGDVLALRVSANYYSRSGWDAPVGHQVGAIYDGRAKLLYKPNDDLSLLIGFAMQDERLHGGERFGMVTGPESDAVTFTCSVCSMPINTGYAQTRQYWGQLDWDLGFATLTYIPALRTFTEHNFSVFKSLTTPGNIVPLSVPHDYFHTEELRLTSNSTLPLQWQTGVFYYRNSLTYSASAQTDSGFLLASADPAHKLTEQVGLFGETTYSFPSDTKLTLGVRGDYTKVQTDQVACQGPTGGVSCQTLSPQDGTLIWRNFTYKARIEQDLTPRNLVYATVSSAFLPGDVAVTSGVDSSGNIALVKAEYGAETLTSFEIGSKNRFLDDRLQINGDVFYYLYGGYQVAGVVGIGPQNSPLFNTVTSPARMIGAELELLFQLSRNDRLALNVGHNHGKFVDQPAAFSAAIANTRIGGIVPWTANPSYSHTFHFLEGQTLTLMAEGLYRSGYLVTQLNATQIADGYVPFDSNEAVLSGNVTAAWNPTENYSLSAYVRNVSDERYKTTVNAGSGADPRDNVARLSEPRTFGVVLNMKF